MKIVTHNDHDGKAAAAIIASGVATVWDHVTDNDITYFAYGKNAPDVKSFVDRMNDGEKLFITDLSVKATDGDFIRDLIIEAISRNHPVVHIDHHQTTVDALASDAFSEIVKSPLYCPFINTEYSGTLLSYVYYCMSEDERNCPMNVIFDTTEERSHLMFNNDRSREYGIPMSVRYIDDADLYTNRWEESKWFSNGLELPKYDLSPVIGIWRDIILSYNNQLIRAIVNEGEIVQMFIDTENERLISKSLEVRSWEGYDNVAFLNTTRPTSNTVSEIIPVYDMIVMYYRTPEGWRYSLRSSNSGDVNVAAIAEKYGGGGHVHASGFISENLIV